MLKYGSESNHNGRRFSSPKGGDNTMTYEFYMAVIATLTLLVAVIALLRK